MRSIMLGSVLAIAMAGSAQAQWEVGVSVGSARTSEQVVAAPDTVVEYADGRDNSYGAELAYRIAPRLELLLGYVDLGEGRLGLRIDSLTPDASHLAVATQGPVLSQGVLAGIRGELWRLQDWVLSAQGGVYQWQSKTKSQQADNVITHKQDGTDWFIGARLAYQFTPALSASLGYQHYTPDSGDISEWRLGASYRF